MRELPRDGHEVVGLDVLPSPYTTLVGSVADRALVARAMRGVDAVVHAATLHKPHVGSHARQAFVDTNVTRHARAARGGRRGGRRPLRLHEHDERVRPRAHPAARRARGVDHRGRGARCRATSTA